MERNGTPFARAAAYFGGIADGLLLAAEAARLAPPPPGSGRHRRIAVPRFTPVPVRGRRDGWGPLVQAAFLGALAETRSVSEAARRVGRSRESAYRLRRRPGAESFACAWDTILGAGPPPKVTGDALWHRASAGMLQPLMHGGSHVATARFPDNRAVERLLRRSLRARGGGSGERME